MDWLKKGEKNVEVSRDFININRARARAKPERAAGLSTPLSWFIKSFSANSSLVDEAHDPKFEGHHQDIWQIAYL